MFPIYGIKIAYILQLFCCKGTSQITKSQTYLQCTIHGSASFSTLFSDTRRWNANSWNVSGTPWSGQDMK